MRVCARVCNVIQADGAPPHLNADKYRVYTLHASRYFKSKKQILSSLPFRNYKRRQTSLKVHCQIELHSIRSFLPLIYRQHEHFTSYILHLHANCCALTIYSKYVPLFLLFLLFSCPYSAQESYYRLFTEFHKIILRPYLFRLNLQ
jgi:muconolactone delta-isomerase